MKIAIWCRHKDDNIIGIGPNIPWHIKSDFQRFKRITEGKYLLAGEKTYESFPNRTLPNRKIVVLTFNREYEVSDKDNHFVSTDITDFEDFDKELYIAGGASVYKAFMTGSDKLMPEAVVDCEYCGDIVSSFEGEKVDITCCINSMKSNYDKIYGDFELDDVNTSIWLKKGAKVDENIIKRIIKAIESV